MNLVAAELDACAASGARRLIIVESYHPALCSGTEVYVIVAEVVGSGALRRVEQHPPQCLAVQDLAFLAARPRTLVRRADDPPFDARSAAEDLHLFCRPTRPRLMDAIALLHTRLAGELLDHLAAQHTVQSVPPTSVDRPPREARGPARPQPAPEKHLYINGVSLVEQLRRRKAQIAADAAAPRNPTDHPRSA